MEEGVRPALKSRGKHIFFVFAFEILSEVGDKTIVESLTLSWHQRWS